IIYLSPFPYYSFSGEKITISYNQESRFAKVTDTEGDEISSVIFFWFAWQAFYPDTFLWRKK
ncbi:MAG TPA: hypothetical protein DHM44_00245, partial [Flexistipes sinusarabici]|nr:hypothetical protein [Flexistipes sinusarabici]